MEQKKIETIKTKLKFTKSDRTGCLVGYVSINTKNGYIKGVRPDCDKPKKVCVISKDIAPVITEQVLYDVEMIPMKKRNGYVVTKAIPHAFQASIESSIVHNAVYYVKCKFGNRIVIFNPLDGKKESMRTVEGAIAELENRQDIKDLPDVIEEFRKQANIVLATYKNDGYYVKRAS